jgi:hypothetical protein
MDSVTAVPPGVHRRIYRDLRHITGVSNVVANTLSRPLLMDEPVAAASKTGRVNEPSRSRPASAASGPLLAVVAALSAADYSWLVREQRGCAATQAAMASASLTIRPFEIEGFPCCVTSLAGRSGRWLLNHAAGRCFWLSTPWRTLALWNETLYKNGTRHLTLNISANTGRIFIK